MPSQPNQKQDNDRDKEDSGDNKLRVGRLLHVPTVCHPAPASGKLFLRIKPAPKFLA